MHFSSLVPSFFFLLLCLLLRQRRRIFAGEGRRVLFLSAGPYNTLSTRQLNCLLFCSRLYLNSFPPFSAFLYVLLLQLSAFRCITCGHQSHNNINQIPTTWAASLTAAKRSGNTPTRNGTTSTSATSRPRAAVPSSPTSPSGSVSSSHSPSTESTPSLPSSSSSSTDGRPKSIRPFP